MGKGYLAYPMRSPQRDCGWAHVGFNPTDGVPVITYDDQDIIASVAKTAEGIFTLTLNQKYLRVRAVANIKDTDPQMHCRCTTGVEGAASAANTVVVQFSREDDISGISANLDPVDEEVDIFIFLKQN